MAYFECLNELKLIVDLMYEGGLGEMWHSVSDTAEYGGLTRGEEVIDRENMEEILEEVQNGEFAREWINENQANRPAYKQYRDAEQNHQIEAVGENLRELFAWAEDADAETTEAPAMTCERTDPTDGEQSESRTTMGSIRHTHPETNGTFGACSPRPGRGR